LNAHVRAHMVGIEGRGRPSSTPSVSSTSACGCAGCGDDGGKEAAQQAGVGIALADQRVAGQRISVMRAAGSDGIQAAVAKEA
jgi:hypothetical protein